ncbi:MAG: hypothetical protein ACRDPA_20435 [Solirubrobacteraceae bacterium]
MPGVGTGEVPRRALDEQEIRELVAKEIDEHRGLADEHDRVCRHEEARRLRSQASLLEAYL